MQAQASNNILRTEPDGEPPGTRLQARLSTKSSGRKQPPPLVFWFVWVHLVGASQDSYLYPQGTFC